MIIPVLNLRLRVSIRYLVTFVVLACPIICNMAIQNLNMSIIAMIPCKKQITEINQHVFKAPSITSNDSGELVQQTVTTELACPVTYGPKYDWSESTRNNLTGANYWLSFILTVFSGRLAEIYGGVPVLLVLSIGVSLINALSPIVAAGSVEGFFFLRLLLGAIAAPLYPTCYSLITNWHPPKERMIFMPLLGMTGPIGFAIMSQLASYFILSPSLGWEYTFYTPAALLGLWVVLWIMLGANSPSQYKSISIEEYEYIESGKEQYAGRDDPNPPISWLKVFKSRQIIVAIILQTTSDWSFLIIQQFIPSYLNFIIGVEVSKNSQINAMIYILFCISGLLIGFTSTRIVQMKDRLGLKTITIRKIHQEISVIGQVICSILFTQISQYNYSYYSDLDNEYYAKMAQIILYVQIFTMGFVSGCEVHLPCEISQRFAGTMHGIVHGSAKMTGFLVPISKNFFVKDSYDKQSWDGFFYFAAGVSLFGGLVFLILGGNEPEDLRDEGRMMRNAIDERERDLEFGDNLMNDQEIREEELLNPRERIENQEGKKTDFSVSQLRKFYNTISRGA